MADRWIRPSGDGVVLAVKAAPRARKTGVADASGDWIRIRLDAPPADGKANFELVRFLAETLGVPRSAVAIAAGASSRMKRVRVAGIGEERARKALAAAAEGKG